MRHTHTLGLGLIGRNIQYSLSPLINQRLSESSGIPAAYRIIDAGDVTVGEIIHSVDNLDGFNVTIPFKKEIMPFMSSLSEDAAAAGAVNTVCRHGDKLTGHNTDVTGFGRCLDRLGINCVEFSAVVLGAGGAASAVCLELARRGIKTVTVYNRTRSNAVRLAGDIDKKYPGLVKNDVLPPTSGPILAVNCTPASNTDFNALPAKADGFAIDLNYAGTSGFLEISRAAGLKPENGLAMLVYQASESWRLWTGHKTAPETEDSIVRELKKRI